VRRAALLAALALALAGCQTTAEQSAELQRAAKRATASRPGAARAPGVTRPSAHVKVLDAVLVRSSEGAAAVVRVRNDSARAFKQVPIAITLKDASGRAVFQNDEPGSEAALVSIPSIPARGQLTWVDDQLPASSQASSVSARVGEGTPLRGNAPLLTVERARIGEESTSGVAGEGTIRNASKTAQVHLVVFAVARRGGRAVAAGRAVVAGTSRSFQLFFVGDPRGAQLQLNAPPTTLPG
jgi:hypothetical protein